MQKLLQAKNAIQAIEASFQDQAKLWVNSQKLREIIMQLDLQYRQQYQFFLIEIYTNKLDNIEQARKIALALQKDVRPLVRMEANLRLAHINLLKQKYLLANNYLQKVKPSSDNQRHAFSNFCKSLLISSKYSNILQGMNLQAQKSTQGALSKFESQLSDRKKGKIDENINKFAKMRINNLKNISKVQKGKMNSTGYKKRQALGEQEQLSSLQYNQIQKFLTQILEGYKIREQEQKSLNKNKNKNKKEEMEKLKQAANKKLEATLKQLSSNKQKYKSQVQQYLQKMRQTLQGDIGIEFYYILKQFTQVKKQQQQQQQEQQQQQQQQYQEYKVKSKKDTNTNMENTKNQSIEATYKAQQFSDQNSLKVNQPLKKIDKNSKKTDNIQNTKFQQTYSEQIQYPFSSIKEEAVKNFTGSYMVKIHEGSDGYQKRYFYFDRKQIKDKKKIKLYYNLKQKDKQKSADEYYDITNFKSILEGKKSQVFERSSCKSYEDDRCFTIQLEKKSRSFYVPDLKDYQKWIYVLKNEANQMYRTSASLGFSKVSRISKKADFS